MSSVGGRVCVVTGAARGLGRVATREVVPHTHKHRARVETLEIHAALREPRPERRLLACEGREVTVGVEESLRPMFERVAPLSAGRVAITWREVACDVTGPLAFQFKDGSSQYWTAIQIRNHRHAIAGVEVENWSKMAENISKHPGEKIPIVVKREGARVTIEVTPAASASALIASQISRFSVGSGGSPKRSRSSWRSRKRSSTSPASRTAVASENHGTVAVLRLVGLGNGFA